MIAGLIIGLWAGIMVGLGLGAIVLVFRIILWMLSPHQHVNGVPRDDDDYHKKLLAGPCKKE